MENQSWGENHKGRTSTSNLSEARITERDKIATWFSVSLIGL